MSSFVHERRRHKKQRRQQQSSTPVYVGVIVAGALVGEKMVNKGFDSAWERKAVGASNKQNVHKKNRHQWTTTTTKKQY